MKNPKTPEVAAVILAAGQSSRMGAFKPLLPFGDKTVIESTIDYLSGAGIETIIVVVGHRADEIKSHLKNRVLNFITNPDPHSAMATSIMSGLSELPSKVRAVLITPVDHPAVPIEAVSQLINEWRDGARLVIPINGARGGHPVLIDLSFRAELLRLDPDRGLKSFFDAHREEVKRVVVESNYIARDMDTWDDYRSLHEEVFGVLPAKERLSGRETSKSSAGDETN